MQTYAQSNKNLKNLQQQTLTLPPLVTPNNKSSVLLTCIPYLFPGMLLSDNNITKWCHLTILSDYNRNVYKKQA